MTLCYWMLAVCYVTAETDCFSNPVLQQFDDMPVAVGVARGIWTDRQIRRQTGRPISDVQECAELLHVLHVLSCGDPNIHDGRTI